jgi:dephospho-CoA kinase
MIIGVCGRVSAGKETLTSYFREKGFVYFETRQIIIEELKKLGLELSRKNMQDWADEQRAKFGVGAIMKIMLEMAGKDSSKNYMFDSLRNAGEAEFLRKNCKDFILIGVDAPLEIRFERARARAKPSDPVTWEEFVKMDERDNFDASNPMGQQTGKLLEISDFVIMNDKDLESARKQVEEIWKKIEEKDDFKGIIIEESLENNGVLKKIKIIETKIEKVIDKHKTPWIKQWTLHTVEIDNLEAKNIAEEISKALDKEHNWYADFKSKDKHFIVFRDKVFLVNRNNSLDYQKVKEYGISIGIPEYQLDFSSEVE